MADLPKSIRIGYRDYDVSEWDRKEAVGDSCYGTSNIAYARIRISLDHDAAKNAGTLLHEILHACYASGALQDGDSEERIVTVLSNQLTQVWRDNPEFVRFMNQSLTESMGASEPRQGLVRDLAIQNNAI